MATRKNTNNETYHTEIHLLSIFLLSTRHKYTSSQENRQYFMMAAIKIRNALVPAIMKLSH